MFYFRVRLRLVAEFVAVRFSYLMKCVILCSRAQRERNVCLYAKNLFIGVPTEALLRNRLGRNGIVFLGELVMRVM